LLDLKPKKSNIIDVIHVEKYSSLLEEVVEYGIASVKSGLW
jgi:hypothetical protein